MLDYIGYVASLIVLISLLMSSIKKLRWINLAGALLFGAYGFFVIKNIPTGLMNLGIVIIDIYYLIKMYSSKEFFRVLSIKNDYEYLNSFIEFYEQDIKSFTNIDELDIENAVIKFYVLRNMNPAGIFICSEYDKSTLNIDLDYVIPQFRDFKMGDYVFKSQKDFILESGYNKFVVFSENKKHIEYVKKMGFVKTVLEDKEAYIMNIK